MFPVITQSFSEASMNMAINNIVLKLDSLEYTFVAESMGRNASTTLTSLAQQPNPVKLRKLTAITQRRSRSPILVPFESSYASSY